MKTKGICMLVMLFSAWTGFAQNDWFERFSDHKDITQVTVTKALLKMVPEMATSMNMNGVNVGDITSKLEQIDIFTSEIAVAKQLMRKEMTTFFKNNKSYEVLIKIKDKTDNVIFYGQKEGGFIKSLIMFADNEDECVVICLSGKFTTEDIQKITEIK